MTTTDSNPPAALTASLRKLEFAKVLERVAKLAVSEPGRESCLRLLPLTNTAAIRVLFDEVDAAKAILIEDHATPLSSFRNIVLPLRKTSVENQILTPAELLDIALVLRSSREMHVFLRRRSAQFGAIARFVPLLVVDKVVEYNIAQAIDESGSIKDSASRELRQIRLDMSASREALHRRLGQILRTVSEQDFTQDDIITTRDGRLVIPIKSEFKARVSGFIHSSSASGATVFIEPTETLELNNALRELQIREQREIQRILLELTRQVGAIRTEVEASFHALVELDVIFAKGRHSIEIIGVSPVISDTPRIILKDGRHPVLLQRHERATVVPLDLKLEGDSTTLVITGPNAGGKTVALKTVGLLCSCAAAGLHIPAGSDSVVFPFTKIFVDIGDDQSLEQDLSTFSSHLVRLREILAEADDETLVLVDEIGSGTDPDEGAAIAMSVLSELTRRRSITVATTHQGSLKVYAHNAPGVLNGSLEFDAVSLRPTFRFRSGIPGSSFALELAERIGLPAGLLFEARASLGGEKVRMEALLMELDRLRQELEQQRADLTARTRDAEDKANDYRERLQRIQADAREIRAKATAEARALLQDQQKAFEQAVRGVRESAGDKEKIRAARSYMTAVRARVETETEVDQPISVTMQKTPVIGDHVKLREGNQTGDVVSIDGDRATIVVGSMKVSARLQDLDVARKETRLIQSGEPVPTITDAEREVDVRGLLGDEAVNLVERALERAMAAGLHRVDIIHGKGTGALRKRIGSLLTTLPYVKTFRLGEWNEGGTGVTVVELTAD